MRTRALLFVASVGSLTACGSSSSSAPSPVDTGIDDATAIDSTVIDSGAADDGVDLGIVDTGSGDDAPAADSSAVDASDGDDGADATDADDADDGDTLPVECVSTDAGPSEAGADADPDADAGTDADESGAPDSADAGPATCGVRVRMVASNLTSGTSQSYEAPGIDILKGLQPDVVMIQEFKYSAGTVRQLVDAALGPAYQLYVEPTGTIPNGIISRYPIVAAGEWDDPSTTDRDIAWAHIDVPGSVDLWVVSMHLLTTSAIARDTQAKFILAQVAANVPPGDYLVIGGDTNSAVENEAAMLDFANITFVGPPYAVDQAGNDKTNQPRSRPHDWVLPGPSLFAREVPVSIGANQFPTGLVFDTRVYTPLTDVPPVLATDSAASNMQHMAIVRDFLLGP